ncbi:MAG TPA: hypothetical protein PK573_16085 [Spirochaetota bacterium]|nr:hypothetical protein [Spirochaetota bacterium]HRZ26337.1 hypothetical protein [Spirochaetota bacterium]
MTIVRDISLIHETGLMHADMLAKQLGGKFEIRNEGGSVFTLSFALS